MLAIVSFLACVTWTIANPIGADGDYCAISTKYKSGDLAEPQPLLLKRNGKQATIWYPDKADGTLRIPAGDSIYLACPGRNNYLAKVNWGNEVKAVCLADKIFYVNGEERNFSSLTCRRQVEHQARQMSAPPCLKKHTPIEIGFNVSSGFIRLIELCRDDITYTTYYTKFQMLRTIESAQIRYPRPKFLMGEFYPGINLDQLYRFETQLDTLSKILNSTELAKQRLKKSVQFLSRGHMVAKADFVYGSQQRATFWYLNTAPQWQSFNGGNWNTLEMNVRQFAVRRQLDLDVYTGVHGHMTMEDFHGKQRHVWLHADYEILSAPKFYWKIIYDPVSKRGTAFVGLNDPFIRSITDDVYLCADISDKIKWLEWQADEIPIGISYACSVGDLRRAVPTIPALDVIGILA